VVFQGLDQGDNQSTVKDQEVGVARTESSDKDGERDLIFDGRKPAKGKTSRKTTKVVGGASRRDGKEENGEISLACKACVNDER